MASGKKLFAVIAVKDPQKMEAMIAEKYPDMHRKTGYGEWLLVDSDNQTTEDISRKLLVTDDTKTVPEGSPGSAMIVAIANYFGMQSQSVWEWIEAKSGGIRGA